MSRYVDEHGFPLDDDCEEEKTLTDKEIVNVLKCCGERKYYDGNESCCCACPLITDGWCTATLAKLSLDIINRQKAELLKEENKNSKLRNERNRLKAKIERYKQALRNAEQSYRSLMNSLIENKRNGW